MDDTYQIKVLQKAFNILELFNENALELTASEIQQSLSLNKTTTFRLLKNLEGLGYLEKDPESQRYRLGIKLVHLGSLVKPYITLKRVAKSLLLDLNKRTKETVHLAVLHKGQSLYLEKIEGSRTIRVTTSIGSKLPAHCSGVGKVLLSGLNFDKVAEIAQERGLKKYTANTIDNLDNLAEELRQVRVEGLAVDNEEIEQGLMCVAAPIFYGGSIVAAVSLSVPKDRFLLHRDDLASEIKKTAAGISQLLDQLDPTASTSNSLPRNHRQNPRELQ